jgi:hypothetical protein
LINPQDGQLLREHLRQARGRRRIEEQDQPAQSKGLRIRTTERRSELA